jgi:dethiobiotin synthetase
MPPVSSRLSPHGFFVTGTDTGVGKTLAACALLHAFSARGLRAVGMKPVAAGARRHAAALRNEDVDALTAASNVTASRALINVYCFEPPIAPHIAACEAGMRIELAPLKRAYEALTRQADVVVVEGVGGFCVPLNEREDTADLAVLLQLPVLLVVGMRLGCLNHALLTAAAIGARGLRLAGWIANHIDPELPHADANVAVLERRLSAPCVARIPFQRVAEPRRIATLLQMESLVGVTGSSF